jgi:hypothetical protein
MTTEADEAQLASFIDKFSPEIAAETRTMRARMRSRFPTAVEMAYDNYNALAIGYGPSEKASLAIFSLAVFPKWVTLCFLQGAKVPDPHGLLKGGGSTVRHVRLSPLAVYDDARVQALMDAAVAAAREPFAADGAGYLVIKSISAKQRPRR